MSDKILITGATGYIGSGLVKNYYNTDAWDIIAVGRNPEKLNRLKNTYPNIRTVLQELSLSYNLPDADVVVHTAAQKHVSLAEEQPIGTIHDNIFGTIEMLKYLSYRSRPKRLVFISTDKSANAGNVYGMTKYLAERAVLSEPVKDVVVCRFGNVFGSSGSVIPLWFEAVKNNRKIRVTNPDMTRFMFRLRDALGVIDYAVEIADNKDIIIPKMRAVRIGDLVEAFKRYVTTELNLPIIIDVTGATPGEKLHESLNSPNEQYGYENEHIYTINENWANAKKLNLNISSNDVERIPVEELFQWIKDEGKKYFN